VTVTDVCFCFYVVVISCFGKDTAKLLASFTSAQLPTSQSLTAKKSTIPPPAAESKVISAIPYPSTTTTSLPTSTLSEEPRDPLAQYKNRISQFTPVSSLQYTTPSISSIPPPPPIIVPPTAPTTTTSYSAEVLARIPHTTRARAQRGEGMYVSQRAQWAQEHHPPPSIAPTTNTGYDYATIQPRSKEDMQQLGNYLHSLNTPAAPAVAPSSHHHQQHHPSRSGSSGSGMEYYPHHRTPLLSPGKPLDVVPPTYPLQQAVQSIQLPAMSTDTRSNVPMSNADVPTMAMLSAQLQRLSGSNTATAPTAVPPFISATLGGGAISTQSPASLAFQARLLNIK